MPVDSISMCSNLFYMSNMDVGSSLRWLSDSTRPQSPHFDCKSDPEPPNLSQEGWVKMCKAATICMWQAYQCAQVLFTCPIWIREAV
jgi:hypothetical protein